MLEGDRGCQGVQRTREVVYCVRCHAGKWGWRGLQKRI